MNATKRINVNFSSLVGLKAELLRKQTEVREAKGRSESLRASRLKRKSKQSVRNAATESTANLTDVEDINAHKKSKLALEAKSRLYERLKKSKNNDEQFLVDFENKSDESEEEILTDEDYDSKYTHPDDAWVEYEDCFGRTRTCLRKDLPYMQKKDALVKEEVMRSKYGSAADNGGFKDEEKIQKKEPEIEIMRRKWEEQTQKLADKVNIHYQNVLFDEARAHGVGYYAFSQDEEERAKQQENLAKLRKDTQRKQEDAKELRTFKERMEQNRLKAARVRQRIRAGLPAEPEDEVPKESSKDVDSIPDSDGTRTGVETVQEKDDTAAEKSPDGLREDKKVEDNSTEESKIKELEEGLGKSNTWREMSQEEWIYNRRKDRVMEFGPTYDNCKNVDFSSSVESELNVTVEETSTRSVEPGCSNDKSQSQSVPVNHHLSSTSYCSRDKLIDGRVASESIPKGVVSEINREQNISMYTFNDQSVNAHSNRFLVAYPHIAYFKANSTSTNACDTQSHSINSNVADTVKQNNDVNKHFNRNTSNMNKIINEEKIMAGLKYLREKFEESQNH